MFCPNCGHSCDDGAAFCAHCGNRIPQVQGSAQQPSYEQQTYQNPPPQQPVNSEMLMPNKVGIVWGILMLIFCQLIFGILAVVYTSQADNLASVGRYREADAKYKTARTMLWWGLGVGLGLIVLSIVFFSITMSTVVGMYGLFDF